MLFPRDKAKLSKVKKLRSFAKNTLSAHQNELKLRYDPDPHVDLDSRFLKEPSARDFV